ncbi:MAG: restriction endonuclease subunit S [Peptostreptococcaceae bacterium]|nr:restriction endonuclease subunit S [Peptostreptococcaceae bacterium]
MTLSDVCDLIIDCPHSTAKDEGYGYPLIRTPNIGKGRLILDGVHRVSLETYNKRNQRAVPQEDDLILAREAPVGNVAIIKNNQTVCLGQRTVLIRPNKEMVDSDYLVFYLLSPLMQHILLSSSNGATVNHLNMSAIRNLEISLPRIDVQRKIGKILSEIADKIEINEKINRNLEEQAQTIFKEWFINNPLNEAWKRGTFSDVVVSTLGGDWGKDEEEGNYTEQVYCIRGADIPEVKSGNMGKMPTRFILPKNLEAKRLMAGDVVIEISGGSPTQSTGRVASISQSLLDRYDKELVCTNFCRALKPKVGFSMFVYYYWQYMYDKNVFFSYENGTTGIKNLNIKGFLSNEEIIVPPVALVKEFDSFCHSIFDQIFKNGLATEKLSEIRDVLLPKLMAGELDVSDLNI